MSTNNSSEEVLFDAFGSTRVITLNRPKALNALNLNMVEKIIPNMKDWVADKNIRMIVIKAVGEKAFCAGGDIKFITDEGRKDPRSMRATQFFRREYILNNMIGSCPVPFVALIDGITMGGGVGLSVHAPFRVATERTVFAMPETAVGLFPDVGGGHFLPRLPGSEGAYLALTGERLKGEDVYRSGVATHYVTHEGGLYEKMTSQLLAMDSPETDKISRLLDQYTEKCVTNRPFKLAPYKHLIDSIFNADTMEEIYRRLEDEGSEWSTHTLNTLKKMSPSSMKVTLEQLKRGAHMTLPEVLSMELRIGRTIMENYDFYEGVRAVLVDKDNKPVWRPSSLEQVSRELVQSYFSPMPEGYHELEV